MEVQVFANSVYRDIEILQRDVRSLRSAIQQMTANDALQEKVTKLEGEIKAMKARMGKSS